MVTKFEDPYPELKKAMEAAPTEADIHRLVAEMNDAPLTAYQRDALGNLARARKAELNVSVPIPIGRCSHEEAHLPHVWLMGSPTGGQQTSCPGVPLEPPAGVDAQKALEAIAPAEMPPKPELPAVPTPPKNPQEALANIKKSNLSALRTQISHGLLDEQGNLAKLNAAQELTVLALCTTYDLQPSMKEVRMMGGAPYIEIPGVRKIVEGDPLFREWLAVTWPIEDFQGKRFLCRGGLRKRDPAHPDDRAYDSIITGDGYADEGNVTKMIADPKGKGGAGFIRDMAKNRMIRELQELAFPTRIDWAKAGIVIAGAPADAGAEVGARGQETSVAVGPTDARGSVSAEPPAKPAPPGNEPATDAQVAKIRELAKSSSPTVQLLKAAYQKEHGDDPAGGDGNARWTKATASKFIDEALDLLRTKK